MDHNALIVAALANVPTIITLLIGLLYNNNRLADMSARIGDSNSRMAAIEGRMGVMDNRLANLDHKFDTRFDMLLGKVVEIDNRLTRMAAQRH